MEQRRHAERQTTLLDSPFEAAAMLDVEIGEAFSAELPVNAETGQHYRRALALVRLHSRPLGLVELPAGEDGISADQLARRIWEALPSEISAHLREDGLPEVTELSSAGLSGLGKSGTPPCLQARERFLTTAPFVSVVIPTHNRPEQVVALVHSVLASAYPLAQFEVIVIDNAPGSEATAELVQRTFGDCPQVRYVREERAGSSLARNRGLALAQGQIVVFADDDVLVDRHWLAEMVRGFEAGEDVACVTSLIVPMELETQAQEWFEQFGGFCKSGMARRSYNLTDHRPESPLFPYNVGLYGAGASMAFRRSALLSIGGFDLALGPATPTLGGEDIDAMLRLILAGHTLVYSPDAIVRHQARREYAALRRQMQGYGRGLSACLFKSMITQPRHLPGFLAKLPKGLFFAVNPRSAHHAEKRADYPKELSRIELRGLFSGPLAYLLSRGKLARSGPRDVESMLTTGRVIAAGETRVSSPRLVP